jgi:outer membrane protein assembly factor BamB
VTCFDERDYRRRMKISSLRLSLPLSLILLGLGNACGDDWPQWLGPQRDGVWRETEIVDKLPSEPAYVWRTEIGAGYAGPAVANGRVFVMDRKLGNDAAPPADPFSQGLIPGTERAVCLDEATGKILWVHEYDCPYTVSYAAGPRATPTVDGDRVYTLGTEGDFFCLSVKDGSVKWQKDFKKDYGLKTSTWGWASAPLIDGNNVISIVGGDGSTVVAFDKITGEEVWRALASKEPGYGAPMIYEINGRRQLIVWHPQAIAGLDLTNGDVLWEHDWEVRYGLTAPTPRQVGDKLFFTTFYNGSKLLDLSSGKPVILWMSPKISEKDTQILHSIISTPVIVGDTIFGVGSYGQLRGIDLETGERLWEELEVVAGPEQRRWGNAFIIPHKDRYFIFNERGDLILANMTPAGFEEVDRMHIIEPDNNDARTRRVVWSHPAFANGHILVRNDHEIVSVSLRK